MGVQAHRENAGKSYLRESRARLLGGSDYIYIYTYVYSNSYMYIYTCIRIHYLRESGAC